MKRTIFIFGAGAAHDSLDAEYNPARSPTWQPPLTDEIFGGNPLNYESYIKEFPSIGSLMPKFRRILRSIPKKLSLEELLERLVQESTQFPYKIPQVIEIRFYLRRLLQLCSDNYINYGGNYSELIDSVQSLIKEKGHVTFVTFNYDLLIENAYKERGIANFFTIEDYHSSWIELIKLHGFYVKTY